MAFAYEIKDRLVAQSVGTFGTNIFIGSKAAIPTGDGPYLSIRHTGGSESEKTHNGTPIERPTAAITVRAMSYAAAQTMVDNAYTALGGAQGLHGITLSGVHYLHLNTRQPPTDIGLDEVKRIMFSFNIRAEKQPS